ncbi:hypothetical protein TIFTF001_054447 [Ficus carica]|nr:hypothetical protein TIFTF001_054447 [Ficus carica]
MNIFFFNILRYLVGSPQYFKKVAQQLITLHQDCLEGNFRANKFLSEARNPTQAVKKGRQVYGKKRQRIRRSRNRAN